MPDSTAAIRSWAQNNGHHVAERGRLSVEVREAYAKSHRARRPATAAAAKTTAAPAKTRPVSPTPPAPAPRAKTPTPAKRPTAVVAPAAAMSEPPPTEDTAAAALAVRVAVLERQLNDLTARVAAVEAKKRSLGRRRSA